jgi:L,D-transpeptidase catalytic domain
MALTARSFWPLVCLLVAMALPSCTNFNNSLDPLSPRTPQAARPEDILAAETYLRKPGNGGGFYLNANQLPNLNPRQTAFVVELDQQKAYLYHGSELVAVSRISSGRPHHRTETGLFSIGQRKADHRSNLYGDFVDAKTGAVMLRDVTNGFDPLPVGGKFQGALMQYFMRFNHRGGSTAMGFHIGVLPGRPASHGCVRLPAKMAQWFFNHVPEGTRLIIRGEQNGVPFGTPQPRPKQEPKIHPSLKKQALPLTPLTPPSAAEGGMPESSATGAAEPPPAGSAPVESVPTPGQ